MSGKGNLSKGLKIPKAAKKTPVREEDAQAFEGGASEPSPKKKSSSRRRAERGERLAVYVPPELAEKLRFRCVRERRSLSDAVTAALQEWLD